ncbi:hypothetical protein MMC22_012018, partial [Lobaria immixta]|nr:hypothetical protein [Lobaria immixta]
TQKDRSVPGSQQISGFIAEQNAGLFDIAVAKAEYEFIQSKEKDYELAQSKLEETTKLVALNAKTVIGEPSGATGPGAEALRCCLVLTDDFTSPFLLEASRLFPILISSFAVLSTGGEKATPHEGKSASYQHTETTNRRPPKLIRPRIRAGLE